MSIGSFPASVPFDELAVPLGGSVLVEAAAGAGKTHALTRVYLRLLLEAGLPVESILVVTFSGAASAELCLRLRAMLDQELAACEGVACAETGAQGLRTALWKRVGGAPAAARLLRIALHTFDEAGICTIHALCRRVLSDYAPLHGLPGRVEVLLGRDASLWEEAADLWRREFYGGPELYASRATVVGRDPDLLVQQVESYAGRPGLRWETRSPPAIDELRRLEQQCRKRHGDLRAAWRQDAGTASEFLLRGPALKRNLFRVPSTTADLRDLEQWLEEEELMWPARKLYTFLEKLCPDRLAAACKQRQEPPRLACFEGCAALLKSLDAFDEGCEARWVGLQQELLRNAAGPLWKRKRRLGRYTFQDLLHCLAAALRAPGGKHLAADLRQRYKAVLVDEFQDTDPVQHELLRRVFRHPDAGPLFMVGDPKQAIYGFRGADLRVFLEARRTADACFHLPHNWRSAPGLVHAVNAIFGAAEAPFLLPEIEFRPAEPAPAAQPSRLAVEGDDTAPFRLWLVRPGPGEKAKQRSERVAAAVAAEAARLLDLGARGRAVLHVPGARPEERPLRGRDLACLVRTHNQAEQLRRVLSRFGVAGIVYGRDSVYAARVAEELWQLLWAVLLPEREDCVRAALATEMLGRDAPGLLRLKHDETAWGELLERFRAWHERWRNRGFMAMFRELLRAEEVPRRLLALRYGERRLADLLQLGELLHRHERDARAGMGALVRHLEARRRAADQGHPPPDEEEPRLESDEESVRILTMHRAKGLEFPVVFCPFPELPRPRAAKAGTQAPWLRRAASGADRAELRFEAEPREAVHKHAAEEHLRLSYVALTRARCRCYLVWTPPGGGRHTPTGLERLLHPQDGGDDPSAAYLWLERESGAAVRVQPLPEGTGRRPPAAVAPGPPPAPRRLARPPPRPRTRVASYSLLVRQHDAERPDYDDWSSAPPGPAPDNNQAPFPAVFPAGARAGHCLHEFLEQVDFQAPDDTQPEFDDRRMLARTVLRRHGFDPELDAWMCELLRRVLATELEPDGGLRLACLPHPRRLNELAFDFSAAGFSAALLGAACERHAAKLPDFLSRQARELSFEAVQGYITGRIDLVFEAHGRYYLADYKSHLLGPAAADYAPERLEAVMGRDGYGLQCLIYTLALHRYLRWRLPGYDYERHFGSVYYLFLRGMDPARAGSGTWRGRFPRDFVAELDAALQDPLQPAAGGYDAPGGTAW